jgi:hypothetical protein
MRKIREMGTDATFRNKDFLEEKILKSKKKVRLTKKCKNEDCQNQTTNTFCSRSCSCRHHNKFRTSESMEKQKRSLRKTLDEKAKNTKKKKKKPDNNQRTRICVQCGRIDTNRGRGRYQSKFCLYCNPGLSYRDACSFKFDLRKYPEEFDLRLLAEHGIFHPVKNPKGVSRDHKVSVKFGLDNQIDPRIIAHPANCDLLLQSDNSKKFSDCSISLEGLLCRIEEWDSRYHKDDSSGQLDLPA